MDAVFNYLIDHITHPNFEAVAFFVIGFGMLLVGLLIGVYREIRDRYKARKTPKL